MADPSKTEPATPKRRQQARDSGQIARSTEVNTFLVLLFTLTTLRYTVHSYLSNLEMVAKHYLGHLGSFEWSLSLFRSNLIYMVLQALTIVYPVFLAAAMAGLLAGMFQAGLKISLRPIMPNPGKLNPLNGFKRVFSLHGLTEFPKSTIKIFLVGLIAYTTVKKRFGELLLLGNIELKLGLLLICDIVYQLIVRILIVLAILAILDYLYQKRQFENNMRMTKTEIKEELKQAEGDPQIRSRIRAKQRQIAMRRMMQEVPKAVVVVTNPVHLAIALKYEDDMAAPQVIAKGAGFIAERIKEIAKENKIPILERPPVAQLLFRTVDLGKFVPPELYHTVAEIIAYVYQLKGVLVG